MFQFKTIKIIFAILIIQLFMVNLTAAQNSMDHNYYQPELIDHVDDSFILIAHRGASAYYPENTIPAFEAAIEMDAEMIELDVQLSKDGTPVVFHDADLARCTNGRGKLKNHTLEGLKELDAGKWFAGKFKGTRIPTLEEVLQLSQNSIALNIEIKTESVTDEYRHGIEEKCIELVREYDMEQHVMFSSFDYRAVRHVKRLDPKMPAALLYNAGLSQYKLPSDLVNIYEADAFNCSQRQLSKKWLADVKANGFPLYIYTVDKAERMRELISLGVDGIFTNKPDVLKKTVERWSTEHKK